MINNIDIKLLSILYNNTNISNIVYKGKYKEVEDVAVKVISKPIENFSEIFNELDPLI